MFNRQSNIKTTGTDQIIDVVIFYPIIRNKRLSIRILDDRISHNTDCISDRLRRCLYGTDVDRDCKYIQFPINDEYLKTPGLILLLTKSSLEEELQS